MKSLGQLAFEAYLRDRLEPSASPTNIDLVIAEAMKDSCWSGLGERERRAWEAAAVAVGLPSSHGGE
jgi:hypothetical protein